MQVWVMGGLAALFILFGCLRCNAACSDTLQYLTTAELTGKNLLNVTTVGLVNGEQFILYNLSSGKITPNFPCEDEEYWKRHLKNEMEDFQSYFHIIIDNFIHDEGVHTLQVMYGCWLDDDNSTRGYRLYAYDREELISLNFTSATWITPINATRFKSKWDPKGKKAKFWKNSLETTCGYWVKKVADCSRETLNRKVRPEVYVFQKDSSSPEVVCHATGFFPKALNMTWQKDGEDVYEDVELRETLANQDGSSNKSSILKVPAEELQKHTYTCVIQHSSLEKELVLSVSERLRGGGSDGVLIFGIVAAVVILIALIAGIVIWRKKKNNSDSKLLPDKASNGSPVEMRVFMPRCPNTNDCIQV